MVINFGQTLLEYLKNRRKDMNLKVNCKFNDTNVWCKHKIIKRSFFGIGARCCIEYSDNPIKCELKEDKIKRPIIKNG